MFLRTYSRLKLSARVIPSRHSGKAGLAAVVRTYTGIELTQPETNSLLPVVKKAYRFIPNTGITELFDILYHREIIAVWIVRCLHLEETEFPDDQNVPGVTGDDSTPYKHTIKRIGNNKTRLFSVFSGRH